MGLPGPIKNSVPIVPIQKFVPIRPLIDRLIEPTKDVDAKPDPVIDPDIERDFSSIQATLKNIIARVGRVGYIDSQYGELKGDLASMDTGLTALRKALANYGKR